MPINTDNGLVLFLGTADSTGRMISGQYVIAGGTCYNDNGTGAVSQT
jgi:hypothetical protein